MAHRSVIDLRARLAIVLEYAVDHGRYRDVLGDEVGARVREEERQLRSWEIVRAQRRPWELVGDHGRSWEIGHLRGELRLHARAAGSEGLEEPVGADHDGACAHLLGEHLFAHEGAREEGKRHRGHADVLGEIARANRRIEGEGDGEVEGRWRWRVGGGEGRWRWRWGPHAGEWVARG